MQHTCILHRTTPKELTDAAHKAARLTDTDAHIQTASRSYTPEGGCMALYDVWRVWLYALYALYALYTLYSVTGEP